MERGGKFGPAVAMVIPTLNEAEAIGPLIARVPRDIVSAIIVADGGSTDATVARATAAGARVVAAGRGYGRACLRGAIEAGSETEIIVFMDGDGSDHPEVVATLVDPIARGSHDFVIGSRIRGQREVASMGAHQVIAGRLIGAAIGALYEVTYTDMCAFRAIRRDVLLGLGMREMTYGWNLEMQMRVARAGLARARSAGSIRPPPRRHIQGGGFGARRFARCNAHPLDLRSHRHGAATNHSERN